MITKACQTGFEILVKECTASVRSQEKNSKGLLCNVMTVIIIVQMVWNHDKKLNNLDKTA